MGNYIDANVPNVAIIVCLLQGADPNEQDIVVLGSRGSSRKTIFVNV